MGLIRRIFRWLWEWFFPDIRKVYHRDPVEAATNAIRFIQKRNNLFMVFGRSQSQPVEGFPDRRQYLVYAPETEETGIKFIGVNLVRLAGGLWFPITIAILRKDSWGSQEERTWAYRFCYENGLVMKLETLKEEEQDWETAFAVEPSFEAAVPQQ
jgi:hypothetical protein